VTPERRRWTVIALIALGAALRTWQFLGRGTLWLDEAAIARNVLARSWRELLDPLDYAQIAPRGFLLATKAATAVLGANEHALRLYAFLLSLAALPLFFRLASRVIPERASLIALGMFAVLGRPIYYGSEAKQYGGDAFFAVLLLLLAVPVVRGEPGVRHVIRLALAGVIAVWFSQTAVFVLAGVAVAVLYSGAWRTERVGAPTGERRERLPLLAAAAVIASSALVAVRATLHSLGPADNAYMRSFWRDGFPHWTPNADSAFVVHLISWPFAALYGLFYDLLGMPIAIVGLALAIAGATILWRLDRAATVLLVAPLLVALTAGALHLFPFGVTLDGFNKLAAGNARVLLFLIPSLVLIVAVGLGAMIAARDVLTRRVGWVLVLLTLGTPLYYDLATVPYTPHDLRPVIDATVRNARPGDRLYVYYGARQAFDLYRDRFPFADSSIARGDCHRPAWREYLRELDTLRGSGRLWVLMVRPALVNGVPEGQIIDDYLGQISPRLARWGQKDAYVSLYDMRIVRPLPNAASVSHPPPRASAQDTVALGFSCAGIFPAAGADTSLTARRNPRLNR
jgi:hypothetical protein